MPDHTEVIITYQARYFNYNNKIIARKYFAKRYATIILICRSHKNRPKKQTVNKISVLSICFQQRGKYKKRRALRRRVTIFIYCRQDKIINDEQYIFDLFRVRIRCRQIFLPSYLKHTFLSKTLSCP